MVHVIQKYNCFGGVQTVYSHNSVYLNSSAEFAVFVPKGKVKAVLFYLSGLTCNWENVMVKSGIQRIADQNGVMFVAPDTSPRGHAVANVDMMNLGHGAGFYLNAKKAPWAKHYQMYDYIVKELPTVIDSIVSYDSDKVGILGHSMGGHGALTIGIRNPGIFRSVSAFAPICNPVETDWGKVAFETYISDDKNDWLCYDSCELIKDIGYEGDLLIDQGSADSFLRTELRPDVLVKACKGAGVKLDFNMRAGYDHSYYFVSSFLESHVKWHLKKLL